MTRTNRPDTLLTNLRDIERRLRLLEAGQMRTPAAMLAVAAGPSTLISPLGPPAPTTPEAATAPPVPLLPARTSDWPGTGSLEWDRLAVAWTVLAGHGVRIVLHLVAESDTVGVVRVVADGELVGAELTVTQAPTRHTVMVSSETAGTTSEAEFEI